jgi:hypothetical protein
MSSREQFREHGSRLPKQRKSFLWISPSGASVTKGDLTLEQTLRGAGRLELFESPLQNQFPNVAKRPPLPLGELFEFGTQVSANP